MSRQRFVPILVAAPIVALAFADGGFGPAAVGIASVGVWATLAALLVSGQIGFGGGTRALLIGTLALGLLAALAALSTAWASDDGAAFEDLNRTLLYAGTVLLVALAARRGSTRDWLTGIALGGTVVALVALVGRLGGLSADHELALQLPLAAERLSYPIGYWNGLGYLAAMTLTALAYLAGGERGRAAAAAVAASVPVVVVIFLTSSRGALVAAAIGVACILVLREKRSGLLAAAIAALPIWLVAVVLTAARRSHIQPPAHPGLGGIALGIALMVLAVLAGLVYLRVSRREFDSALIRRVGPVALVAGGLALVAAAAVLGAGAFVGTFRGDSINGNQGAASGVASDSDRSAFWGTALSALGDDPLRGTGAGGFPLYWNQHGNLPIPVENAHSAPIEVFAELGLPGGALFLVFLLTPLWVLARRIRGLHGGLRADAGAVLGITLAGLFAITIDWTWDLPAAIAPLVVCIGLTLGRALEPEGEPSGSELVDARMAGYEELAAPARPSPVGLGLGVGALSLAAIAAGVVLALAAIQLSISNDRLAAGDLDGAAKAARAAEVIEPWNAAANLQLAAIEQAGNNYQSAEREAIEAIRSDPDEFRSWFLLAALEAQNGSPDAVAGYTRRALMLAPNIISKTATPGAPQ